MNMRSITVACKKLVRAHTMDRDTAISGPVIIFISLFWFRSSTSLIMLSIPMHLFSVHLSNIPKRACRAVADSSFLVVFDSGLSVRTLSVFQCYALLRVGFDRTAKCYAPCRICCGSATGRCIACLPRLVLNVFSHPLRGFRELGP